MKQPRLYVNGKFQRIVYPINVTITQSIVPLDTASMTLPEDETLPARSWVELFTPYGSAGMFRVRSPHDAYGLDTTSVELEHMISEVGDYLVKEEISEMLPANTAMQRVFKHYNGGKWKLGSVSALGSDEVAVEAKYERVLDVMLSILEQKNDCMLAFDFTTSPWTVSVVKKGTTVSAEGRLARNVTSANITCDDTELCTRVWYQTFDKKKNATWTHKDANTISKYGVVEDKVRTSSDMAESEIEATVNAFLNDHKEPRVGVNIQGTELSEITGESLDKMTIGKLYRLAIPEKNITTEMNITSIMWADVYNNPRNMTINLGAEEDTVVTFLHNLDSKGKGGGGGGKAKDKEEEQWSEYKTEWVKTDEYIAGMALKQDKQGTILEQAGLTLNAKGLLVYATDNKNSIGAQFNVLNKQINMKVSKGNVIAEINLEPGEAKIRADKIILDGEVVAKSLQGKYLGVGRLKVEGAIECYRGIYCESNIICEGNLSGAKLNNKTIDDFIANASVSGNTLTLTKANGQSINFSKATTLTGVWSAGNYKVTASPQGVEINSGGLTSLGGQARRDGNLLYVPINAGTQSTGYEAVVNWKNLLTQHTNCVAGLSRYNNGNRTTLYRKDGDNYTPAGTSYWYYRASDAALTTYYS